jgi:hypothetical protein
MISLNLDTSINVLPDEVEKEIIKLINKKAPTCYKKLSDRETKYLEHNIIDNLNFNKYNINLEQIQSIRSSYIKNKMIKNHSYLLSKTKNIVNDYTNKKDILYISKKYDGSPLNIMRIILAQTNSKEKIKKLFNKPELLDDFNYKQFVIAKDNDNFALVNQDEIQAQAEQFERQIEEVLKKINVKYKTQNQLAKEQIKSHGRAFSTPDFLIESELIIGGHEIKWIDAKNFYGSNASFVKSKINEQTRKYIKNHGKGSIIFNLGFNESYFDPNILFLSWGSFNKL